jgi:hypothetical protein
MCWRQLTVKTYTKALHERSVYDLNTAVADRILNRVFIRAAAFKRGFRLALTTGSSLRLDPHGYVQFAGG